MCDMQFNPRWFRSLLLMGAALLISHAKAAGSPGDDAMPDLGRIRPPPANDSARARR